MKKSSVIDDFTPLMFQDIEGIEDFKITKEEWENIAIDNFLDGLQDPFFDETDYSIDNLDFNFDEIDFIPDELNFSTDELDYFSIDEYFS